MGDTRSGSGGFIEFPARGWAGQGAAFGRDPVYETQFRRVHAVKIPGLADRVSLLPPVPRMPGNPVWQTPFRPPGGVLLLIYLASVS